MNTKPFTLIVVGLLALAVESSAQPRYVTLTAPSNGSNILHIRHGETAELVSFPNSLNAGADRKMRVEKDGQAWELRRNAHLEGERNLGSPINPFAVTGPARVLLFGGITNWFFLNSPVICTFRITPDAYPPTGTVVIPPVEGGGVVQLECSTNLLTWQAATNGVYTNLPTAKFFRLTLERLP